MSHFLHDWTPTLVAAAGVTVLGVAGMMLTPLDSWYYNLRKPSWQPPNWLFGPAWTTIFILEAASAVIGWQSIHTASGAALLISAYVVNGLLNMLWSLLFFKLRRPDWALREVGALWLSILAIVVLVATFSQFAALFMLPYLFWVAFAAVLNRRIVALNAPFRGRP